MIIGEADLSVHVLCEGAGAADHDEQQQHTRGLRNVRCPHGDRARRQPTPPHDARTLENELTNDAGTDARIDERWTMNGSQSDHFKAFCLQLRNSSGARGTLRGWSWIYAKKRRKAMQTHAKNIVECSIHALLGCAG